MFRERDERILSSVAVYEAEDAAEANLSTLK